MFGLGKHAKEFFGYAKNHEYERTADGILFPKAHALLHGTYIHDVNGEDERQDRNLIVDEGLVYLLSAAVTNDVADVTTWYLSPYSTAYTPLATLTAALFTATTGEITANYDEATRVAWVPDAVDAVNTEVVNDASPAVFTFNATQAVEGAGMLSASAKSAITGTLLSATKFAATRNFVNTDVFNLKYKIDTDAV